MQPRIWILVAALSGASGVTLGAFQAHGLSKYLESKGVAEPEISRRLANCETGVRYQMLHAPVLLLFGVLPTPVRRSATISAVLMLAGMALFSGGLYLGVFTGSMGHWAIVPSGGACFILGWLATVQLAISYYRSDAAPT